MQDLNQDLHPVILNPVAPGGFDPQLGMDLQFNMHEQHLLQHQGEVYFLNPLEEELAQLEAQAVQNIFPPVAMPVIQDNNPPSPQNFLVEEIHIDQLMDLQNEEDPIEIEMHEAEQAQPQLEEIQPNPEQGQQNSPVQAEQVDVTQTESIAASARQDASPQMQVSNQAESFPVAEIEPPQNEPLMLGKALAISEENLSMNQLPVTGKHAADCNLQGKPIKFSIAITGDWAPFFNSMLLSPDNKTWATQLLSSPAAAIISKNMGNIFLPIPSENSVSKLSLTHVDSGTQNTDSKERNPIWDGAKSRVQEDKQEKEQGFEEVQVLEKMTPFKKRRATRKPSPIVDSQVRRSARVMKNNNGFKSSSCPDKRCFSCNPKPPTLSKAVILDLGMQLCDLDQAQLSDEALMSSNIKKKKTGQIARRQDSTAGENSSGSREEQQTRVVNEE